MVLNASFMRWFLSPWLTCKNAATNEQYKKKRFKNKNTGIIFSVMQSWRHPEGSKWFPKLIYKISIPHRQGNRSMSLTGTMTNKKQCKTDVASQTWTLQLISAIRYWQIRSRTINAYFKIKFKNILIAWRCPNIRTK